MNKRGDKREKQEPSYLRSHGTQKARSPKQRKLTFSISKHLPNQGQTFEDWDECGLSILLWKRLKHAGQFTSVEARQDCIKEYTKVEFPPGSKFKQPTHITGVTWAVMHLKPNSKEVVVGYIEDDVFYIVFLDKEHQFWPTSLKNT